MIIAFSTAIICLSISFTLILLNNEKDKNNNDNIQQNIYDNSDQQNNNTDQNSNSTNYSEEFNTFLSAKKELYVWSHSFQKKIDQLPAWVQLIRNYNNSFNNLLQFCNKMQIQKIYLFAGSVEWEYENYYSNNQLPYQGEFIAQLKKAKQNNIQVDLMFYLNDEVDNLQNYTHVSTLPEIVYNISQQTGIKFGIHMDQEPQNYQNYNDLIKMFILLKGQNYNTSISTSIKPLWLRQKINQDIPLSVFDKNIQDVIKANQNIQSFADLLIFLLDETSLMSYSNNKQTILNMCDQYQERLKLLLKPGNCIIETGFINNLPQDETLYYTFQNEDGQNDFYNFIGKMSNKYNKVVIHDYSQFHYMLYCQWPDQTFKYGPTNCQ